MKRMLALLLALALCLGGAWTAGAEGEAAVYGDVELDRAVFYGFAAQVMREDGDAGIGMEDYCAMISAMIGRFDASKMGEWLDVAHLARADGGDISREYAMMVLFRAALVMGCADLEAGDDADWGRLHNKIGEPWDNFDEDPCFLDFDDPVPGGWDGNEFNYNSSAYFFAIAKTSHVSGQRLFEYDAGRNSMRVNDPITRSEAILSVLRLYESTGAGVRAWAEAEKSEGTPVAPEGIDDAELAQAVALGFGGRIDGDAITFAEFRKLLDHIVQLSGPSKVSRWLWGNTLLEARDSNQKMTRADGIVAAYYAAEALGEDYCYFNGVQWGSLWEQMDGDQSSYAGAFKSSLHQDLFPGLYNDSLLSAEGESWYRFEAAELYATFMCSRRSGALLFDYDAARNSLRPEDELTHEEAVRAALRLYESGLGYEERTLTEADQQILSKADARREAVLNTDTAVTVTGKSYYVSESGSDKNKGTSAEKPWKTVKKVNQTKLKKGDAVFFERGGIWRERLNEKAGVTFSAYGTGDKPRFYGSPENGADPEKWSLVPGTSNVWVFHEDMLECGIVVMNDGECWATKTLAWWDGSGYLAGPTFDAPFELGFLEDMHFFSKVNLKGWKHVVNGDLMTYDCDKKGPLYLRCDAGNPGSIYQSIEFATIYAEGIAVVSLGPDSVADNLCVMYTGNCGIRMEGGPGSTVQNCEIGWLGGAVWGYRQGMDIAGAGDGIQLSTSNATVVNTYIHDCYQSPYTVESGWDLAESKKTVVFENINMTGNMFERNQMGGLLANYNPGDTAYTMKGFTFEDNYFMHSGYGWSYEYSPYKKLTSSLFINFQNNAPVEDIRFIDNIFYVSRGTLVMFEGDSGPAGMLFDGNTYAQGPGGVLVSYEHGSKLLRFNTYEPNVALLSEILTDTRAVLLPNS